MSLSKTDPTLAIIFSILIHLYKVLEITNLFLSKPLAVKRVVTLLYFSTASINATQNNGGKRN